MDENEFCCAFSFNLTVFLCLSLLICKEKNTFHLLKLWQPSVCVRLRLYLSLNRLYSLWITVKWEKEHFQVSFQPITAQRNHCCEEYCTQKDAISVCVFHYFCFPPLLSPSLNMSSGTLEKSKFQFGLY